MSTTLLLLVALVSALSLAGEVSVQAQERKGGQARVDGWVYEGEAFKVAFDHDGGETDGFLLEVDGTAAAEIPVTALQPRTAQVSFAKGLPLGLHTLQVHTRAPGGVLTGSSELYRLEVRERRGSASATHIRVVRGDDFHQE